MTRYWREALKSKDVQEQYCPKSFKGGIDDVIKACSSHCADNGEIVSCRRWNDRAKCWREWFSKEEIKAWAEDNS